MVAVLSWHIMANEELVTKSMLSESVDRRELVITFLFSNKNLR